MTFYAKLYEHNHAEETARVLVERLGWNYVQFEALTAEHGDALLTRLVRQMEGLAKERS